MSTKSKQRVVPINSLKAGDTAKLGTSRHWGFIGIESVRVLETAETLPNGQPAEIGRVFLTTVTGGWVCCLPDHEVIVKV